MTVFSIVLTIWTFDQLGSLFILGHHVHIVPKSLRQRIDEFISYLLSKKQIGLVSKQGFRFMHGSLKIRVLYGFACVWKVVADVLKIMASLACEGKIKFKFGKSRDFPSSCSH